MDNRDSLAEGRQLRWPCGSAAAILRASLLRSGARRDGSNVLVEPQTDRSSELGSEELHEPLADGHRQGYMAAEAILVVRAELELGDEASEAVLAICGVQHLRAYLDWRPRS